ncbi:MAG: hypothetical protein CTR55_01440 [Pseudomonas sp.]|uniref:capsule biosynthesis GfcC D2 domain-containing protein n=1 Tax=Pseudomonas sp. TaxID=306 RepID=UPI000CC47C8F|nr:capsule biosynthesis GfcC D2 domain-containing protein [Pseudomonas sp.]PJI50988.1 MAG: hypothetical protein CTR55_01440 [Pseudomonas sp.]
MILLRLCLLAAGLLAFACAQANTRIEVLGDLPAPGEKQIAEGLRLGDLLAQLKVSPQSYWLGASWQRLSLTQDQQRLKAGVLFDLIQLQRLALLQQKPGLASAAQRLNEQVRPLPVTGRRIYPLDPLAVELNTAHSPKLQGGGSPDLPASP